jgi:cysteinyl-tRNA synthetase
MSQKYLGETLDIHGGGKDLVFPHHENEIAQSEAATGKPFARYWIHNGFVNINKEKMSKSLGNILTIKEILKQWHPEVLRLFFLSHHYRSPVDYSEDGLLDAKTGLDRFYTTLHSIQEELKKPVSAKQKKGDLTPIENSHKAIESFQPRFEEAMSDDFNTAQALGYFYELQTALNSLLTLSGGQPTNEIQALLNKANNHFLERGWVFGLFQEKPEVYTDRQKKEGLKKLGLLEEEILNMIEERKTARGNKDWKKSDEIRNDLLSKGIVLEDTPSGTLWKIK